MSKKSLSLILLAGGQGSRLGSKEPKQFLSLAGKPMAFHSLESFINSSLPLKDIVIVCKAVYQDLFKNSFKEPLLFASPGQERYLSVYQGFQALKAPVDYVMIHDSARPFISQKDLLVLFEEGEKTGAAALATPATSTIKQASKDHLVTSTLPRDLLWEMQTPQMLSYTLLKQGLDKAIEQQLCVTDDVSFAEMLQHPVKLVEGNPLNFKITTHKDFMIASYLINTFSSGV
jgi:2-C-methyl-D-erythritol 4-phosphate cytidylyltransferase